MTDIGMIESLMLSYVRELGDDIVALYEKIPVGKRLRAKLILKISGNSDESLKVASIIELIHAASLLHDDVIDDALTRRGVESINSLFGDKTAIMLGDILYSKAYEKLVSCDKKIAENISNAVALLSVGELLDVELSHSLNLDREKYFDMIYKKTAILIEATARSGAILAGLDEERYALYGKNLGLAFQVIDDVLDVVQDSKTLGKPALNDFREGKTTLIYMDLIDELEKDERAKVIGLFGKDLDGETKEWLLKKFHSSDAIKKSLLLAQKLGLEALEIVKNEPNARDLQKVIKEMIDREF